MKFLGIQPKYKLYWNYKKAEELEWTRNKIRDSGTLVTHLESVKDRFWKNSSNKNNGHFQNANCFQKKTNILKVAVIISFRAFWNNIFEKLRGQFWKTI